MHHSPSRNAARIMFYASAVQAPIGVTIALATFYLVFPLAFAAAGLGLLVGYRRLLKGSKVDSPEAIWASSLVFNALGVCMLFTSTPWWGLWPSIASVISVWGLLAEVRGGRRAQFELMRLLSRADEGD